MKILIIYRHFWPDSPPYASMLRTLAQRMADNGHSVEIWCEQPCYKESDLAKESLRQETINGITVTRLRRFPLANIGLMRKLGSFAFAARVLLKSAVARIRGERYDLIWSASIPPVIQGVSARMVARIFGAKFLYHIQDIYPELASHMGYLKRSNPIYKLLAMMERTTRRKADRIITLSQDMANKVAELSGHSDNICIINNFGLQSFDEKAKTNAPITIESEPKSETINFIFAGNLGVFQKLENVIDAMHLAKRDDAMLTFMGEGKALDMLKSRSQNADNIQFLAHRPFEQARTEIAKADIGIVSLEAGVYQFAFPSKTLTYWDLGLPALVIVEPDSALAKFCTEREVALVVAPNDCEGLASAITRLSEDKELRERMAAAVQIVRAEMTLPAILGQWDSMMQGLADA